MYNLVTSMYTLQFPETLSPYNVYMLYHSTPVALRPVIDVRCRSTGPCVPRSTRFLLLAKYRSTFVPDDQECLI